MSCRQRGSDRCADNPIQFSITRAAPGIISRRFASQGSLAAHGAHRGAPGFPSPEGRPSGNELRKFIRSERRQFGSEYQEGVYQAARYLLDASSLPAPGPMPYTTRHGLGYSIFEYTEGGISSEMLTTIAPMITPPRLPAPPRISIA